MNNKAEQVNKNFLNGCNCAQSVLCAYSEEIGLDENICMKLASSFGGGMGRLREVCGAVSAMFMIAGLLKGYDKAGDDVGKARHYQLIQNLAKEFKDKHGTIICRELLGVEGEDSPIPSKRTQEYYNSRSCTEYIKTVSEIIDSKLID